MRILIFEWGSGTYTHNDITETFERMGISYRTVSYQFEDKNDDEFFFSRFSRVLVEDIYDAVFSVNYFPLVAKCCNDRSIKYISWSYDNPLDVPEIEKTLGFPVNHVFLFDRIQTENYRKKGFSNVHHMPLATNSTRLDKIKITKRESELYAADVSFVGKMYDSMFEEYKSLMNEYCRGYIDAIVKAQSGVYGYYFVDELLTDQLLDEINSYFKILETNTKFTLPKEALSYAIAAQITRNERLVILNVLARRMKVNHYSWNKCELLQNVNFMGSADYFDQMPKIFKASKINLNITLKILQSGIPLRVMDILGAGGFLLTNYQPEIAENFVDGQDVVMYESIEDAIEKAIYYNNNDEKRCDIARSGHNKASDMFSYDKQLKSIFELSGL